MLVRAFLIGFAVVMLASASDAQAASRKCTTADAITADRAIDEVTNWARAYSFFQRYGHCDDGSVAEGYDDKVAILLTEKWDTTDELAALCRRDQAFEGFVLKHIDTLMSRQQAQKLIDNATRHCPVGAVGLCQKLAAKARNPE